MKDVARAAGVSVSTVSRVLAARGGTIPISKETQDRVLSAAERLDYKPNFAAQRLRSAQPHLSIGLYIPWSWSLVGFPVFLPSLVEAVGKYLSDHSHSLNVVYYEIGHIHEHYQELHSVRTHLIQGMLIAGASAADLEYLDSVAANAHPPVVVIHRVLEHGDFVTADNRGGAADGVAHLIGHGHRRIAMISKPWMESNRQDYVYRERFLGYQEALCRAGIEFDPSIVFDVGPDDLPAIESALRSALSGPHPPSALFCSRMDIAAHTLRILRRIGARVPDDVALVTFSEHGSVGRYFDPPLTSISIPADTMGRDAVDYLVNRLTPKGPNPPEHVTSYVPCSLVVRESCGCSSVEQGG
jgi:LacI family transcriptional regulator